MSRWILSGLCLLSLVGCGDSYEPGTVSMTLIWETSPDGAVWIWARVEAREDPETPGPILGSAGPVEYQAGQPLSLPIEAVDNGDGRVVVVEVRGSNKPSQAILYYGLSAPFSVSAGKKTTVSVPLVLAAPETEAVPGGVELTLGESAPDVVSLEQARSLSVRTRSVAATALVLANDPSFSANFTTVELSGGPEGVTCTSTEKDGEVEDVCTLTGWDLTGGLPDLGDGLYSVYVKFIDRYGYESHVYKDAVMVDSTAPVVLASTLSQAVASAGETVLLSVTFHEPVASAAAGCALLVEPVGPVADLFQGPARIPDTNTYTWSAQIPSQDTEDPNVYTFAVRANDPYGNLGEVQPLVDADGVLHDLRVDCVDPVIKTATLVTEPELLDSDDTVVLAVGDHGVLRAVVQVREAGGLAEGSPSVSLDVPGGAIPFERIARSVQPHGIVQYVFELVIDQVLHGAAEGYWPVRVEVRDHAGNLTVVDNLAPTLVHLDFTPPGLAGTPVFERCDYLAGTKLAPNDLLVMRDLDCGFNGAICGDQPCALKLDFFLSEEVKQERLQVTVQGKALVLGSVGPDSVVAYYSPDGTEADEPFDPTLPGGNVNCFNTIAQVEDLAGNSTELELGCLRFDMSPPEPPDVDTAGRIVYRRMPWGTLETGGQPLCEVVGEAGAVPPGGAALVFREPDGGFQLDLCHAEADGAFDCGGWFSDHPKVYVAARDPHGNVSESIIVRDGEWVATMGGVTDDLSAHPHSFETHDWFDEHLLQSGSYSTPDAASLGGAMAAPVVVRGEGDWVRRLLQSDPPEGTLEATCGAYFAARDRIVVVVSRVSFDVDIAWEHDGHGWRRIANPPMGDYGESAAMAYDAARQRIVLFGRDKEGHGTPAYPVTWEWDGGAWLRMEGGEGGPPVLYGPAMAYDPVRERVLMFGGGVWDGHKNEPQSLTWAWNGEEWGELELSDAGAPPPRMDHGMTFDPVRQGIVLHGGALDGVALSDFWVLGENGWEEIEQPPMDPSHPWSASMVFDRNEHRLVQFNTGTQSFWACAYGSSQDCTWTDTGGGLPGDVPAPDTMVWDSRRERVVVWAEDLGCSQSPDCLWEWSSEVWSPSGTSCSGGGSVPETGGETALTYQTGVERTLLFGYSGGGTWEWDGECWSEQLPSSEMDPGPDPVTAGSNGSTRALAYDESRQVAVLVGAREIWEWDGSWWSLVAGSSSWGTGGGRHAVAYVPDGSGGGEVLIFGGWGDPSCEDGGVQKNLLRWDGVSCQTTATPCPDEASLGGRLWHSMTWDGDKLLLFGGCEPSLATADDLFTEPQWHWASEAWTQAAPGPDDEVPDPRAGASMSHDSHRDKVLLFGGGYDLFVNWGGNTPTFYQDIWEWDGLSWREVTPADPFGDGAPLPRYGARMAYDSARDRTVLFGGDGDGEIHPHWEWDPGGEAGPGQVLRCSFSAANVGADAEILEVGTSWRAGGTGLPDGVETHGLDLWRWSWGYGRWEKVVEGGGGSAAQPGEITWSTTDPNQLERMFVGPEQYINFAVTTAAPNGLGRATLVSEYAECFVRYRLP